MPRVVWTDENGYGHGMTISETECEWVGRHTTVELHAQAHVAELLADGVKEAHVVTAEEADEAWRTHPARIVNGGGKTDGWLSARFLALAEGLDPNDERI